MAAMTMRTVMFTAQSSDSGDATVQSISADDAWEFCSRGLPVLAVKQSDPTVRRSVLSLNRFGQTTFMVDVLAGAPSIVAALFVFSLWVATLGFQQSAFAVSLALVLLMLPVVVRSTEEMLKLVPDELREAGYALGIPKWKTIVRIVAPVALPGIISGALASIARIIGETAPVLVLVGYSRSINYNIFDGNMASLPLLIYTELTNPEHAGFLRVWGAALTLIIVVAVINLVAAAATRVLPGGRR
jgi:phosphate transport system permease protein